MRSPARGCSSCTGRCSTARSSNASSARRTACSTWRPRSASSSSSSTRCTSLRTNIHGTENVLRRACSSTGSSVLLASTSEIYGKNTADALSRGRRPHPRLAADRAVDLRRGEGHRRVVRPRVLARVRHCGSPSSGCSTRSGPGRPAATAWWCPNLVDQALRDEPLTVFGDGLQTRCFSLRAATSVPALVALAETPGGARARRQPRRRRGGLDPRPRRAGDPVTGSSSGDRVRAVRAGVRRGLRGHAAPRARQHARPRARRVRSVDTRSTPSSAPSPRCDTGNSCSPRPCRSPCRSSMASSSRARASPSRSHNRTGKPALVAAGGPSHEEGARSEMSIEIARPGVRCGWTAAVAGVALTVSVVAATTPAERAGGPADRRQPHVRRFQRRPDGRRRHHERERPRRNVLHAQRLHRRTRLPDPREPRRDRRRGPRDRLAHRDPPRHGDAQLPQRRSRQACESRSTLAAWGFPIDELRRTPSRR